MVLVQAHLRQEVAAAVQMEQVVRVDRLACHGNRLKTVAAVVVAVAVAAVVLLEAHLRAARQTTTETMIKTEMVIRTRLTPADRQGIMEMNSKTSRMLHRAVSVEVVRLRLRRLRRLRRLDPVAEAVRLMTTRPRSLPSLSPRLSRTAKKGAVRRAT